MTPRPRVLRLMLGVLWLFAGLGCPGDDDDDADDDTATDDDTGDDDTADDDTGDDNEAGLIGRVSLTEVQVQHTGEAGTVARAWGPVDEPWENGPLGDWNFGCNDMTGDKGTWLVTQTAGDCELAIKQACNAGCTYSCDYDEYCVEESCIPTPMFTEAGTLTIEGTDASIELEPMNLRYEQAWDLPVDLFDEGDPITLQAAGGATPAFTAATTGVEALQATLPCDEIPAKGQDLVITWTPAAAPGAKVRWEMTQDIHLYQGPRIRCEVDDSGSLTIPAQMMDAYVHAEKHFLFLTRYHDDVAFPGGNREVAFEVGSQVMCVVNPKHTPW